MSKEHSYEELFEESQKVRGQIFELLGRDHEAIPLILQLSDISYHMGSAVMKKMLKK